MPSQAQKQSGQLCIWTMAAALLCGVNCGWEGALSFGDGVFGFFGDVNGRIQAGCGRAAYG